MLSQYTTREAGKRGQPRLTDEGRKRSTVQLRTGDYPRLLRPLTATFRELVARHGFKA